MLVFPYKLQLRTVPIQYITLHMSLKKGLSSLFAPFLLLNSLRFNGGGPFSPTRRLPSLSPFESRGPPVWGPFGRLLSPSRGYCPLGTAAVPRANCIFPSCGLARWEAEGLYLPLYLRRMATVWRLHAASRTGLVISVAGLPTAGPCTSGITGGSRAIVGDVRERYKKCSCFLLYLRLDVWTQARSEAAIINNLGTKPMVSSND